MGVLLIGCKDSLRLQRSLEEISFSVVDSDTSDQDNANGLTIYPNSWFTHTPDHNTSAFANGFGKELVITSVATNASSVEILRDAAKATEDTVNSIQPAPTLIPSNNGDSLVEPDVPIRTKEVKGTKEVLNRSKNRNSDDDDKGRLSEGNLLHGGRMTPNLVGLIGSGKVMLCAATEIYRRPKGSRNIGTILCRCANGIIENKTICEIVSLVSTGEDW